MPDLSQIELNTVIYNLKDTTARESIPEAATATPKQDGTASVGTSTKYARQDHTHPTDTNLAASIRRQNSTLELLNKNGQSISSITVPALAVDRISNSQIDELFDE